MSKEQNNLVRTALPSVDGVAWEQTVLPGDYEEALRLYNLLRFSGDHFFQAGAAGDVDGALQLADVCCSATQEFLQLIARKKAEGGNVDVDRH